MSDTHDTPRVTPGPWEIRDCMEPFGIGYRACRDIWFGDQRVLLSRTEETVAFVADCANAIFALSKHTGRDPAALARWAAEGGLVQMASALHPNSLDEMLPEAKRPHECDIARNPDDAHDAPDPLTDARLAFERWVSSPPYERDITRNPDDETKTCWPGHYKQIAVQLAWEAWQAATDDLIREVRRLREAMAPFAEALKSGDPLSRISAHHWKELQRACDGEPPLPWKLPSVIESNVQGSCTRCGATASKRCTGCGAWLCDSHLTPNHCAALAAKGDSNA